MRQAYDWLDRWLAENDSRRPEQIGVSYALLRTAPPVICQKREYTLGYPIFWSIGLSKGE